LLARHRQTFGNPFREETITGCRTSETGQQIPEEIKYTSLFLVYELWTQNQRNVVDSQCVMPDTDTMER
jgi:hypothetical protein